MRLPMPARPAISRVVAAPYPRSANTVSAASRMRWRTSMAGASASRAVAAATFTGRTDRYTGLYVPPRRAVKRNAPTRRGEGARSDPGPVLGLAGDAGHADRRGVKLAGKREPEPLEAVVVAHDDRGRRAEREIGQEEREVDANEREAD